jgi:hypothetical protein
MGDLFDRRGLSGEWDGIDDETREEILQTNLKKIKELLPPS